MKAGTWTPGLVVLDHAALASFTARIERAYGVKVRLASARVGAVRFNGVFRLDRQPLDDVLGTLAATGHLHYTVRGRQVTLY